MKRIVMLLIVVLATVSLSGCTGMLDLTGSNARKQAQAEADAELQRTYQQLYQRDAIARQADAAAAADREATLRLKMELDAAQTNREDYLVAQTALAVGAALPTREPEPTPTTEDPMPTSGLNIGAHLGFGADLLWPIVALVAIVGVLLLALLFLSKR